MFVLGRAITAAAPAGIIIWLTMRVQLGGESIYSHLAHLLDPVGRLAGMDGVLILAFLFALPAAELMLPLAMAGVSNSGDFISEIGDVSGAFAEAGWNNLYDVPLPLRHHPDDSKKRDRQSPLDRSLRSLANGYRLWLVRCR